MRLPFNENLAHLESNYAVSEKRLKTLAKKFANDTELLGEYDTIIQDQLATGVIETVKFVSRDVVRNDKITTKVRMVFETSAKTRNTPSLNYCLSTGP